MRTQVLALGSIQSIQGPPLVVHVVLLPPMLTNLSLLNAIIIADPQTEEAGGPPRGSCYREKDAVIGAKATVKATDPSANTAEVNGLPSGIRCLQLKWCDWRAAVDELPCGSGSSDSHQLLCSVARCRYLTELVLTLGRSNNDNDSNNDFHSGREGSDCSVCGGARGLPFSKLTKLRYLSRLDLQLTDPSPSYPFNALVQQLAELSSLRRLRLCVLGNSSWCEAPMTTTTTARASCNELDGSAECSGISSGTLPLELIQLTRLRGLQALHLEPMTLSVAQVRNRN